MQINNANNDDGDSENNRNILISGKQLEPIGVLLLIFGAGLAIYVNSLKGLFADYNKFVLKSLIHPGLYMLFGYSSMLFLRLFYYKLGYGNLEKLKNIVIEKHSTSSVKKFITLVYVLLLMICAFLGGYICVDAFMAVH